MIVKLRLAAALLAAAAPLLAQTPRETFFETSVRPLLVERCAVCHSEKLRSASLDLTSAAGFAKGADSGPLVVPGKPNQSRLIRAVRFQERIKMPPAGKLPDDEIRILEEWVRQGAYWPPEESPLSEAPTGASSDSGKDHWSFQPVSQPAPPAVENEDWASNPIDRFILARLEEKNLAPAAPADKLVLLRRAKFGLHGLPPTLDEIEQYEADTKPGAFERLLDRLLAAPQYGEHWARHWLDVARYAESTGVDEDHPFGHAWRYRDYVVDAFNEDLPYDQFIREQIAGDLLPAEEPGEVNRRGRIATGFLALGPRALAQRDAVQKKYDVVDDQIDTVAKAFLGLTLSCARCHDHKFDPLLTADYYALGSIFASTRIYLDWRKNGSRYYVAPLVSDEEYEPYRRHQDKIKAIKSIRARALQLAVEEYRLEGLGPKLADYVSAVDGSAVDGSAVDGRSADGLDQKILERWRTYLGPNPAAPPHVAEWRNADAPNRARLAEEWRELFQQSLTARAKIYRDWLARAEALAKKGEIADSAEINDLPNDLFLDSLVDDDGPFAVEDDKREDLISDAWKGRLEERKAEEKLLGETSPPEPPMTIAVMDGEIVDQHIFVRGRHQNQGDPVPKRFPIVLAGEDQPPVTSGSGRRELANWLASKSNPLTARVMVNRVWQQHFGQGLVATPNNFGRRGEAPTHPELLDYMASRFMAEGWSIKKLHRLIMTSNTYQMSSKTTDAAWTFDPENRLRSRFTRRRLSFEETRDSYLAVSGLLDPAMGGTLDPGAEKLTEFVRNNRRIDPDEYTRRSIYLPLMRNKIPALMTLFDYGDPASSTGARASSNVAPQALYLTNSELASRAAAGLAKRVQEASDQETRIRTAYRLALTREPADKERTLVTEFLDQYRAKQTSSGDPEAAAWTSFCRMLMAANEFHYVD